MAEIRDFYKAHPEYLFFFMSAAGLTGFLVLVFLYGNGFSWVTMSGTPDWALSDFSRHILFASNLSHVYEAGSVASFPPLAYLLFYLLYRMNPVPVSEYSWFANTNAPYVMTMYMMLLLLTAAAFILVIVKITRSSAEKSVLLGVFLLCSLPFSAGAIERGNPVFLTLVLILAGLYLKDGETKASKEAALVLLAAAVNFKLYPAVLILLYLKERRFGEALRFAVYSALLFFLPFALTGGMGGLKLYLSGLFNLSGGMVTEYTSFKHITCSVLAFFGMPFDKAAFYGSMAGHICLCILLFLAWTASSGWKTILFLSFIMSYYLPSNYRYNAVFLAVPLIFLFRDYEIWRKEGGSGNPPEILAPFYMALFGVIMTIPSWIYPGRPEIALSTAAMVLFAAAGAEEAVRFCRRHLTAH